MVEDALYEDIYILVLLYNCFDRSYAACVIELVIATVVVMLSQQEDNVGNSESVRAYNRVVTQLDIFAYKTYNQSTLARDDMNTDQCEVLKCCSRINLSQLASFLCCSIPSENLFL